MTTLFEVSWEVCNKVGGIYTVIDSKAPYVKKEIKSYFFIGPFIKNRKNLDFEERKVPEQFKKAFEKLAEKNIHCIYGIWLNNTTPTILIDFSGLMNEKNQIKTDLWEEYRIDSLNSQGDFDEPVVWSTAVGMLLEELSKSEKESIAQFHEWLSGAGLLYLKRKKAKIATIFTTHATVLERAMANSGDSITKNLKIEDEAYKRGVSCKHQLEKASALNADIFTAVSDPTANASEKIFGRKPEVILINGMDMSHFPNMEDIPTGHKKNKEKIKKFVTSYFFPYYSFDIEKTLFYFTAGRYEFHAKGLDVIIRSLGLLNKRLKEEGKEKTIVFFIFVPAATEQENVSLIESSIFLKNLEEKILDHTIEIKNKILYSLLSNKEPSNLVDEHFMQEIKKLVKIFKKEGAPELSTHRLINPDNDAMIQSLRANGLNNKQEDHVKVILYPTYLGSNDGLLNMEYYDVIWGCQLGVFPSFYEPWGYTPVESAAYGVPSITTDVSGFGKYVMHELKTNSANEKGIMVIERENKTDEEVVHQLYDDMYWYANLTKNQRIKNKIIAESFIMQVSWRFLITNYFKAYKLAQEKVFGKK